MLIIAHRGASAYFKENTIEAFKGALALGAKYFETDVQLSKDGQLVIYHDYVLKETKQPIKNLTSAQLARYDVPLLSDVLATLGKDINLNIEIKNDDNLYPAIEEKLFKLLNTDKNAHKERLLISSFNLPCLQRVRALDANIKIGRLTHVFDIKEALALNAFSVNISAARVNKKIVDTCHAHTIKVLVYTVNDDEQAKALEKIGVDGIFSDRPDILLKNFWSIGLTA